MKHGWLVNLLRCCLCCLAYFQITFFPSNSFAIGSYGSHVIGYGYAYGTICAGQSTPLKTEIDEAVKKSSDDFFKCLESYGWPDNSRINIVSFHFEQKELSSIRYFIRRYAVYLYENCTPGSIKNNPECKLKQYECIGELIGSDEYNKRVLCEKEPFTNTCEGGKDCSDDGGAGSNDQNGDKPGDSGNVGEGDRPEGGDKPGEGDGNNGGGNNGGGGNGNGNGNGNNGGGGGGGGNGDGNGQQPFDFCSTSPNTKLCAAVGSFQGSCDSGPSCNGDAVECATATAVHRIACGFDNRKVTAVVDDDCAQLPVCEGDLIDCAIFSEQFKARCAMFDDELSRDFGESLDFGEGNSEGWELFSVNSKDVDLETFSVTPYLSSSASCGFGDVNIPFFSDRVTLSAGWLCQLMAIIRFFFIVSAWLYTIRMFFNYFSKG